MSILTKYSSFQAPDFEWPEFDDDRDRIRAYSRKFKDVSIAEAFASVYSNEVDVTLTSSSEEYKAIEYCNTHPVKVGDVIEVTIEAIGKRDAVLSYHNSKQSFTLKQNISSWNLHAGDTIKVSVVGKNKDSYVVDCVDPMYQDWIERVNKTLTNSFQSFECTVVNLEMQRGGYMGKINIPEISAMMGKPYYIDAFIPGSQIALNIEEDFSKWDGKSVDVMVTNFTQKKDSFNVACSRKKLLNVAGGTSLVNIYDAGYGRGTRFDKITFDGTVLGIINSAKKHGVFVEVPEYNITGLIEKDPRELTKYHKGDAVKVQIDRLEHDPNKQPYRRNKDGILTEVNIKPVFVEVE